MSRQLQVTAFDRIRAALEEHGCRITGDRGDRFSAQCPAHDDRNPSLTVTGIEGQTLIHCHAGCDHLSVLGALNLGESDLFDNRRAVTYTYSDGRVVRRKAGKKFSQSGNTKGTALYRLDRVQAAVAAREPVYVAEGEKDVLALESAGVTATCSAMGAGNASRADWRPLRDAGVMIVADKDAKGAAYAREVSAILIALGAIVAVVQAKEGKDAADHIAAGYGVNDFERWSQPEPAGDDEPDTWSPVDLAPYLRGEVTAVEPSIGIERTDHIHLLYAGKEHTVIGEMECGKSWLALECARAELAAGNTVVYVHFEESDPADTVSRLVELEASDKDVLERFKFIGPEQRLTDERLARLVELKPSLVILDGMNEAMSLHGWDIRDENGVATFRRCLVKPFTRIGAATLTADHVVKDRDKRGRTALGSIHKVNGLSGVAILLENVSPFGRGQKGCSHVYILKDRPGYLRKHGKPTGVAGKTYLGTLKVDSIIGDGEFTHSYLELAFVPPKDDVANDGKPNNVRGDDEQRVLDVVGSGTVNMRTLRAATGISKDRTTNAVERLVMSGDLIEHKGSNRQRFLQRSSGPQDQPPGDG